MPPSAIASSVATAIARPAPSSARSSGRSADGGNFGAPPKPPCTPSNCRASAAIASSTSAGRERALAGAHQRADRARHLVGLPVDLVAAGAERLVHRLQQLRERRHAVPRLRREVGAAPERPAVRRQEDRHRPAAAAGQRHHRVHVDGVDVGPLLAVDLHAHVQPVHQLRDGLVRERLVLHHVAPVAGAVADREQDRHVPLARGRERLVAPRVPVDGVRGVLEEVGRGLVREPVHVSRHGSWSRSARRIEAVAVDRLSV